MVQSEEQPIICLLSSNSTERYLKDILTILAMPPGSVYHFRYQLKWLDEQLRCLVTNHPEQLKGTRVVIAYVFKKKEKSESERWECVYPVRFGVLKNAFSTGGKSKKNDEDIALFYFEVDKFIVPGQKSSSEHDCDSRDFTKKILGIIEEKSPSRNNNPPDLYAVLVNSLEDIGLEEKQADSTGFFRVCDSIKSDHIALVSGQKYKNIYFYLHGITDANGKSINQRYNENLRKSYYELTEGESYLLTLSVYSPREVVDSKLVIRCDKNLFSSPRTYTLDVLSRYDEESFLIEPTLIDKEAWSSISIKTCPLNDNNQDFSLNLSAFAASCKKTLKGNNQQFLPTDLNLTTRIQRNRLFRGLSLCKDISFTLGTACFAVGSVSANAGLPLTKWSSIAGIALFAVGTIFSVKVQKWRG